MSRSRISGREQPEERHASAGQKLTIPHKSAAADAVTPVSSPVAPATTVPTSPSYTTPLPRTSVSM